MSATNSGVTPAPGLTYANAFLFYARDELLGPDGETLATGLNTVMMDMNTLAWVRAKRIAALGDAIFSMSATIPIANNSLSSEVQGSISGGGGLADTYYQPIIFGWETNRADIRAVYGFLAPTGKFDAGATDNVGSGYWTHTLSSGQTIYLTERRTTVLSAFQMYEYHTTQEDTDIHPGQNVDLDYSLMQVFSPREDMRLQVGLVGYNAWQITDKTGPGITPEQSKAHYRVNDLGAAVNLILPARKTSLGAL